jgi:hypothetical protein
MQADSKLQWRPPLGAPFGVEVSHAPRGTQGAATSAEHMVVPMGRSAPERHDAVANKLVDSSLFI